MGIEKLQRWHWMVLSLLAGFLIGTVQNSLRPDFLPSGTELLPQEWMERQIVATQSVMSGDKAVPRYQLDNIMVERRHDARSSTYKVSSIEPSGNIATLTIPGHKIHAGQTVKITGADQSEYNGKFTVNSVAGDSFKVTLPVKTKGRVTGTIFCEPEPQLIYVMYCQKMSTVPRNDGKIEWMPYIYISDQDKFVPQRKLGVTAAYKPSFWERVADKLKLKEPDPPGTILDYLASVKEATKGENSFQYRWWTQPRIRPAAWMAGCFVVIGVIWPTLINIMLYGSIFAPPREKSASLRGVKSKTKDKKKREMSAADLEQLKKLDEELEAKLMKDAKARDPNAAVAEPVAAAPIRQLTGTAEDAQSTATMTAEERHAYQARADDFYPVERPVVKRDEDEKKD
jgi:hypothetical protein